MNFLAISICHAIERSEAMDECVLIMSGLQYEMVIDSMDLIIYQHTTVPWLSRIVPDYDLDNVSRKVIWIIMSYNDYVNRVVWQNQRSI